MPFDQLIDLEIQLIERLISIREKHPDRVKILKGNKQKQEKFLVRGDIIMLTGVLNKMMHEKK